jgi:N4-gp56 family major capsid protein
MAQQNYSTQASRNLIRAAQGMLDHAEPIITLGDFGEQREMPQNSTDTLVFRRIEPFNVRYDSTNSNGETVLSGVPNIASNSFMLAEGVNPTANSITYKDIQVTLQQYGVLFKFSSKVELLYEDDIPNDMVKLSGETIAEVLELARYGVLKGGTTVIYANGSARNAVNTAISLNRLRQTARTLEANRARRVTSMLAPGPNIGTRPIESAFVVFHHTDCNSDIRNLPDFTKVEEYGSRKPIHAREIGSVEEFRFISSPLLAPFVGAGSGTQNGMVWNGSNTDVYPILVMGEQAWGQVALKGFGAINPTLLPANVKSHANPLGQFGYVGASTWFACVRLNENWMARLECCVSLL